MIKRIMKIFKNGKNIDAVSIFPTIEDFILDIKNKNDKINFECDEIIDKTKIVYSILLNSNDKIPYLRLSRWYPSKFGFRYACISKIDFWLERGWGEDYAIDRIKQIQVDRRKKYVETNFTHINDISFNGEEILIKFKNVEFKTTEYPKCNVCGCGLLLIKTTFKNIKPNFLYNIIKCSDTDCKTHMFKLKDKYKAYLPEEIADTKLKHNLDGIRKRNPRCKEYWIIKGLSEEEAINKIVELQSNSGKLVKNRIKVTKEYLKNKGYSEEEVYEKCLTPSKIKFWVNKGFTEIEAVDMVYCNQINASKKLNELRKESPENFSANTKTQLGYWLNKGYDETESKLKQSEHQSTFSFEKCIQKYGEEEGIVRFTERQKKWQDSLNKNGNIKMGYSKASQDLFYDILNHYTIKDRENVFFSTKNNEYRLNKDNGGVWLYDFTDIKNKKIIEYNGDMFHGNPKKYLAEDSPNPYRKELTAKEIWDKDELKTNVAKKNGFDVLVIWDSEYKLGNKEDIINKCVKFLKN